MDGVHAVAGEGAQMDSLVPELEWVVAEHPVMPDEVGGSPLACGNEVPAVVRDGQRIWVEDPANHQGCRHGRRRGHHPGTAVR